MLPGHGHRQNAARFGESVYFHHEDTLWVNQFIPSTLDWREQGLRLRLETRYPANGDIRLALEAVQPVEAALRLRIPAWLAGRAEIRVNGEAAAVDVPSGGYAELRRTWNSGDVVELRLPLSLRVRTAGDDPSTVSLFHGPVLLAGALGRAGIPESDVGGNMAHANEPPAPVPVFVDANPEHPDLRVEPDPGNPLVWRARMYDPVLKQEVEVRLEPFHRVHHQRYAVYWKVVTPARAALLATRAVAPPAGFIGDAAAEQALNLQGEGTATGRHQGRAWRDASNGGWFSYRLQVDADADVNLVCTYWGGDGGNREFDILVEDRMIATQTLRKNRPGEFFDVTYRVPGGLVRGKQFVTVRFQAHPGAQAGGLFGCRFENPGP
ncbi:MAG: glycoside hydrolase family 127 protein [Kiritimatiellia bacterium]